MAYRIKMVDAIAMQNRNNCDVKLARENYYDTEYECTFYKIYLIFCSKSEYKK